MVTNAVTPSVGARVPALAGLGALLAASAFVRTRAIETPYWIDEGISGRNRVPLG